MRQNGYYSTRFSSGQQWSAHNSSGCPSRAPIERFLRDVTTNPNLITPSDEDSTPPNALRNWRAQIQRKESAYEPGAPNAPLPGTRTLPWAEKSDNLFQLGAVLGCAAVRYGYDRGARKVELLAIRENEKQHSRYVTYTLICVSSSSALGYPLQPSRVFVLVSRSGCLALQ